MSRWAAAAVGISVAVLVTGLALSPPASSLEVQSPLIGTPAPAIVARTVPGQRFSLASDRGHFVVIDFFASWCPGCVREQPQLERFVAENRGPQGARFVAVIFEDSVGNVVGWLGPTIRDYPVIADPTGTIASDYGVGSPPSKFLIDPSGRIVEHLLGPVTAAELEALIKANQHV